MKNTLRSRPRTVANRPTSGGWGNKKCFIGKLGHCISYVHAAYTE